MRISILACALGVAQPSEAACRQALALGLDVSGSVDEWEYRLQLDGVAAALETAEVQAAFLMFPEVPVRLMVFEWSDRLHQRQILGWTEISEVSDLTNVAAQLRGVNSVPVDNPSTAIGAAMVFGAQSLLAQEECWQKTLDLSGDGPANFGFHPRDVPMDLLAGVTINGLVIGPNAPANANKNRHNLKTLLEYYKAYVQRGPGAFVEAADDYEDFERAMIRKLIRELQPAAVSGLDQEIPRVIVQ